MCGINLNIPNCCHHPTHNEETSIRQISNVSNVSPKLNKETLERLEISYRLYVW